MTASEAKKLTAQHSKKMQEIYKAIEQSAKRGNSECCLNTSMASAGELETLRENGYTAGYETSETDGGQLIVVKW